MDKKTKVLYLIMGGLILIVILITFYKVFILHDYKVSYEIPCDPNIENCFVNKCENESEEDCLDNPIEYYKIVEKKVFNALKCNSDEYDCLSCKEGEKSCEIINCDNTDIDLECSDGLNNNDL